MGKASVHGEAQQSIVCRQLLLARRSLALCLDAVGFLFTCADQNLMNNSGTIGHPIRMQTKHVSML